MGSLHIGDKTTTDNEDGLLSNETLCVHKVDNVVKSVHVLVDFTTLDDLPCDGDRVVSEVLVNSLLVDAGDV